MFKILLILVLAYLVYRAGKNLLLAAVGDRPDPREDDEHADYEPQRDRRRKADIEDAVWEDLP